jgi:ribokinase
MTHARGRLYVVGSANMDLVVRTSHLPRAGETVIGSDLVRVPGGKGANQAVAAARLGAEVVFVGKVGADPFGPELGRALAADRVDVSHLRVSEERPTGVALILVDHAGENLIAVSSGANAALAANEVAQALRGMRAHDLLLLQLEVPLAAVERACRAARQAGARVMLNAAPATEGVQHLVELASILVANAGEAAALSGCADAREAAVQLLGGGPELVVVTLGGEGLLLASSRDVVRVPAHAVQPVDTTAAGDAFCGAFATSLLEGRPPEEAARFAAVAAALATTRMGAQSSLPSRADVEEATRRQR